MISKKISGKPYEAAMFLQLNNTCNLDCEYCITKGRLSEQKIIDLVKFENFLKKLDKIFLFIYEGDGEPTLQPQIVELSELIVKYGHYIAITSNMTGDNITAIAKKINPLHIDYVLASAHTQELEKKGLLNDYFSNCLLFKKKGVSVTCLEIGFPSLIPKIRQLKNIFKKNGFKLEFDHFRGIYKGKKYPMAYSKKELKAFNLNPNIKEKFSVFSKPCNAGFNFFGAELVSTQGDIFRCRFIRRPVGNVLAGKINFDKEPRVCFKRFCTNPYTLCNDYLHNKMIDYLSDINNDGSNLRTVMRTFYLFINFLWYEFIVLLDWFVGQLGIFIKNISPSIYRFIKRLKL